MKKTFLKELYKIEKDNKRNSKKKSYELNGISRGILMKKIKSIFDAIECSIVLLDKAVYDRKYNSMFIRTANNKLWFVVNKKMNYVEINFNFKIQKKLDNLLNDKDIRVSRDVRTVSSYGTSYFIDQYKTITIYNIFNKTNEFYLILNELIDTLHEDKSEISKKDLLQYNYGFYSDKSIGKVSQYVQIEVAKLFLK